MENVCVDKADYSKEVLSRRRLFVGVLALALPFLATSPAAEAQDVLTQGYYRWRNDDGIESAGAGPIQVTATADATTASTTDVLVSGMAITPGAGDYLV
jgi:hypothetical protein